MTAEAGTRNWGGNTMVGPLRRVLVYPPVEPGPRSSWQQFGYLHEIDHAMAVAEHASFRKAIEAAGVEVVCGAIGDADLQDGIFPYDPSLITDRGVVLCRMGKQLRSGETALAAETYEGLGIPILGSITAPGTLEGGDCLWVDPQTLAVGRGYRSNAEGIRQLAALLAPQGVNVISVDLPYWHGPAECLHLLSLISLVDRDLAVVYEPLLAVAVVELLEERSIDMVTIPHEEFASQGCNVLALAPRHCLMLQENVESARRLEAAGCSVTFYKGAEISHNRSGGPTCLTRPLLRTY